MEHDVTVLNGLARTWRPTGGRGVLRDVLFGRVDRLVAVPNLLPQTYLRRSRIYLSPQNPLGFVRDITQSGSAPGGSEVVQAAGMGAV